MYFSPNSAGEQPGVRATYSALFARRVAGAVKQRGWPTPLDDPALARVALHRISPDPRDRTAARSFAAVMAAAPALRVEGMLALATLDVADGAWAKATAQLVSVATLDPDAAATHRAWLALSPAVSLPADTLRVTRRALLALKSAPDDGPDYAPGNAPDDLNTFETEDVRSHLAGMLSARLGDSAGVVAARTAIARHARGGTSRVATALMESLTGHWHVQRGEDALAVAAFANAIPALPARLRRRHDALGLHVDRLVRSQALSRLGRTEEAARWQASLREGSGLAGAPYTVFANRRSDASPE
jgi:hypothetical protein